MRTILAAGLILGLCLGLVPGQTPQNQQQVSPEDVIRISTQLVQTDVVVMDKNEQIISDLKLEDFEVYDNGKRQELQFMEFVSVEGPGRTEGSGPAKIAAAAGIDTSVSRDITAKDLKRVIAFVVDDVTIPHDDMARARAMLSDFVNTKMMDGDLVAVVRTIGGMGLLEQFTSDKTILQRAIAQLGPRSIPPHLAFTNSDLGRISAQPSASGETGLATVTETVSTMGDFEGPSESTNQVPRAVVALSVANQVVDALRQIPGRKNLVLISGGLPLFDLSRGGSVVGDVSYIFEKFADNATRSGVVINTMDIRALQVAGAVAKFDDTPGRSALLSSADEISSGRINNDGFGRGMDTARLGDKPPTELLTLRELAGRTGGVAVTNSNNFAGGLEKVLGRSRGYYRLAYRPTEKFDNKYHSIDVKVRRPGARIFSSEGYVAREDKAAAAATKEEQIVNAAISPLAQRSLDVAAELQYKFASNQAHLDINTFLNARKLNFKKSEDGKYQASFDVVGFVFDQVGRSRGGFSETVNANLTEQDYQRALLTGITYSASTQVPPGYYQVRLVVREAETGKLGTVSRYFEVPDLSSKSLLMSSILLYEVAPGTRDTPVQLSAARVISRDKDLRYAAVIYNAKAEGGKPQVRSRLIISQNGKVLFQEPEQPVTTAGSASGELVRVGQLGMSKVSPGRYVLTLVTTDPLADKKRQTVSRSVDFTVVN
ncbi:MAG TPA: VWA domain-containing protein [Pyrinomonadaceae bacterium]|nr:VWA domain-containing protein [Pyrinomonadaceae bacterium]